MVIEQQHGRLDERKYHVLDARATANQFPDWSDLQIIGVVVSYRDENKKKTLLEMRYFISSKKLGRDACSQAVRGHWALENRLHWVLDVTMGEDTCPFLVVMLPRSLRVYQAYGTEHAQSRDITESKHPENAEDCRHEL